MQFSNKCSQNAKDAELHKNHVRTPEVTQLFKHKGEGLQVIVDMSHRLLAIIKTHLASTILEVQIFILVTNTGFYKFTKPEEDT